MFTTEADVPACSFETNIGYTFCFLTRPIFRKQFNWKLYLFTQKYNFLLKALFLFPADINLWINKREGQLWLDVCEVNFARCVCDIVRRYFQALRKMSNLTIYLLLLKACHLCKYFPFQLSFYTDQYRSFLGSRDKVRRIFFIRNEAL